jgi:hypothetical protein
LCWRTREIQEEKDLKKKKKQVGAAAVAVFF